MKREERVRGCRRGRLPWRGSSADRGDSQFAVNRLCNAITLCRLLYKQSTRSLSYSVLFTCQRYHLLRRLFKPIKRMQRQSALRNLSRQRRSHPVGVKLTILCPASSFVPRSRTTTGTLIFKSRKARMIPSAIMSQRVSPPKMLTKIAFTRGSDVMIRNDDLTVSDVALPPVSRKLAQCPPWMVSASTVFIARPAPFTVCSS